MAKRPVYTKEFKDALVAEGLETTFTEVAKKHGLNSAMIGRWSRESKKKGAPKSHKAPPKALGAEALIEKRIAELQEQIEIFRKAIELIKTI